MKGCQGSGESLLEGSPSHVLCRRKNLIPCGGDARCRKPELIDAAPADYTSLPTALTRTPSCRTGTNSGGCLSATFAAAPLSTCASPTRSSTWSRRRWWPRAVAAVACSSRSSRRAEGWGAPGEVGPSLPLLPWQAAGASPLEGDCRTRHLAWPSVDILHWCRHVAEGLALCPSSIALGGRDSQGSSVEQLMLLVAT